YATFTIFQSSYIQYSPDSFLYKALSQQPLTLHFLVNGDRSPTLPVLLKLFRSEGAFVYFQLAFFYLSWLALFAMLYRVISVFPVYIALLALLCSLSLAQIFFSWHKLILTESVSLSGAVLLLALLSRFMVQESPNYATVCSTLVAWVMWQFTRDANAFFSLLIALGFFTLSTIARLTKRTDDKWKKGQLLSALMIAFAAFQIFSINSSQRWQFPLVDVIALRVLPSEELTKEFVAMGMPMNDKVLCFKGKTAVDCNNDWTGFGAWFDTGEARKDYQSWLIQHFDRSLMEVLHNWEKIWTTETILYGRSLETEFSKQATRIALPRGQTFLLFCGASFLAAVLALCVSLHHGLRHWLSVLLMFWVANLPVAFVAFHGDALDVDRHTLNVQLNTYVTGWILIGWSISFVIESILAALMAAARGARNLVRPKVAQA
ncbi:MAG: hypothetical protein K2Q01_03385, partial [Rickettsiales bacterium]|nr:hypothetical protein [Rickettsiales bacterium]